MFHLRPATEDDVDFLRQVYSSTRAEELALVDWTPAEKDAFLRMQFDAQHREYHARYPTGDFLVIRLGDRNAGRLYVARLDDEIRIIDIALLPDFRGQGVGTSLLRDLIAESESAGKPLRIHVEQFNPAQRLYARLGFRKVATHGLYDLMERPAQLPA